jgi:hypothetical protein
VSVPIYAYIFKTIQRILIQSFLINTVIQEKGLDMRPVIGWMTKIYYLEFPRALEGTLSRWSWLHLQSFVPTPVSRRVDVRQATGRKNNCRIFITT